MDAAANRQRLSQALQQIASGDPAALQRVYDLTSAKLFGICVRILKDSTEAEDVLQDVYVTVWRRAGSFDAERGVSPITWLSTLARNRAIDRLRTSKAHLSRPLDLAMQAVDPTPLADDTLEKDQTLRHLVACLGELDPEHAGYIHAAFFDGHTYASLAEAVGAPLGTMKSWVRRALTRLRACLER